MSRGAPSFWNALRSMPALKCLPAPVMTPTTRSESPSSCSRACTSPVATALSTAFSACGRLMVTTRMLPSTTAVVTLSVMVTFTSTAT